MTKGSDNPYPKVTFLESSAPSTPASTFGYLYEKTDGKLYFKNDAGTETEVTNVASTGTNLNPGTSFPGGPSTNDLCFRTDRGLLYYYDGTRWLTTEIFEHFLGSANGASATSDTWTASLEQSYDAYVLDMHVNMECPDISGSRYWTVSLYFKDGSTLGSAITSVNNSADTNNAATRHSSSVNALMGTGKDAVLCEATKTSTPGVLYFGALLTYRLVG